jgi:hypothetical protein
MEDLIQQLSHWKCRLTVAAENKTDHLPRYEYPKKPMLYENRDLDDALELVHRLYTQPRFFCGRCYFLYWGAKDVCPIQAEHDEHDERWRINEEKRKAEREAYREAKAQSELIDAEQYLSWVV